MSGFAEEAVEGRGPGTAGTSVKAPMISAKGLRGTTMNIPLPRCGPDCGGMIHRVMRRRPSPPVGPVARTWQAA